MDIINGCFEAFGALFILFSIVKLHKDKLVRGVSWLHVSYFWLWGIFNLVFYPAVGLQWSYYGAVAVFIANTIWFAQLVYYNLEEA